MIELTIHGRGGQGGVTLAKLIATSYFLRGKYVQAFGVYAAERSGAPVQAYVRIDDEEITNHNQVYEPDHVIVLDPTLIGPRVAMNVKEEAWIVLNTPKSLEELKDVFPGRKVAVLDATSTAVERGLGTRAVPIVNTTILGALARVFEISFADIEAALAHVNFGGANVESARQAYAEVQMEQLPGKIAAPPAAVAAEPVVSLLDDDVGGMPRIQTGSWATRQPARQQLTPPCNQGCPAANDVRSFVEAMGKDDATRALEILLETTPFPGVCGRVCPAPCMEACNRAVYDESINIREIERYAAEHGRRPEPKKPWREGRIAVIGSGPAGLSATYSLARLGYPVTVFEAGQELGGLLRTGIPGYRLPRDVLDEEIEYILRHGVSVQRACPIDRDKLLTMTREFAAVVIGTGLQEMRMLDLGVDGTGRVLQGIDFLDRVCRSEVSLQGEHIVVIGGGNTAVDAARSARRVGAQTVRIVYRRSRQEMPAITEEIAEALEEGIELDELVAPLELHLDGARPSLTCTRMELGAPDESGRPRPIPSTSEDARFDLRCDRLILALGQSSDVSILPAGSEISEGGNVLGLSGAPVLACGDFATNDGTVCAAIGGGRRTALHVHRTLSGEDLFRTTDEPLASPDAITMHIFAHAPAEQGVMVPPQRRNWNFTEVRRGFVDRPEYRPAVAEAQRCFSCGVCNNCDRCVTFCPEGVMVRDGSGYRFDESYCKGCGVCAAECPRGVIYMSDL